MDVVLEFSSALAEGTLAFYQQSVAYEGHPIPGSPFNVFVTANPSVPARQPRCQPHELGTRLGGWVLQTQPRRPGLPVNFTGAGHAWEPAGCRLPEYGCLLAAARSGRLQACLPAARRVRLLMIGDSLTRKQMNALVRALGEEVVGEGEDFQQTTANSVFDTRFQAINGGLRARMPDIERAIDGLAQCQASGECHPALHFNSGLHDLDKYCAEFMAGWRREQGYEGASGGFDCLQSYREGLQHVIQYAAAAGLAGLKSFRTSTAAWLKFGNWRVDWPAHRQLQPFTQSWYTVERFNAEAVPLFKEAGWHCDVRHCLPWLCMVKVPQYGHARAD